VNDIERALPTEYEQYYYPTCIAVIPLSFDAQNRSRPPTAPNPPPMVNPWLIPVADENDDMFAGFGGEDPLEPTATIIGGYRVRGWHSSYSKGTQRFFRLLLHHPHWTQPNEYCLVAVVDREVFTRDPRIRGFVRITILESNFDSKL
jgi:hypothetical protein